VPQRTETCGRSTSLPHNVPPNNILTSSAHLIGEWEGPEALEGVDEDTLAARAEELKSTRTYEPKPEPEPAQAPPPPESESEDDDPSTDEYMADEKGDAKRTATKVRPIPRLFPPDRRL